MSFLSDRDPQSRLAKLSKKVPFRAIKRFSGARQGSTKEEPAAKFRPLVAGSCRSCQVEGSGIVSPYARQWFQLLYGRRSAGGLATCRLLVHQLLVPDTRAILTAFVDLFEDATPWYGANGLDPDGGWPKDNTPHGS